MKSEQKKQPVDLPIFITTFALVLLVSVPMLMFPDASKVWVTSTYDWISQHFGLLYQWGAIAMALFVGWIAFSRHGKIRLGGDDVKVEFSNFSWVSMLFCGGVGAGLIYWATIEWAYYMPKPPFGAVPGSPEGQMLATSYGLFHWGPMAWAIYALPTVAISYQYYVRGAPNLRLSTACYGLLGHGRAEFLLSRFIDALFMISLLAGAGTSIGLAVPMISASIADTVGIHRTLMMDIGVVLASISLLAVGSYAGLSKGISKLADFNVKLTFAFLLFILIAGPTLFILRLGTESLGYMLTNMLRMVTYTDAIGRSGFVEDWTIFYWAWWIAYGPIVGIFVSRISKGRTLKQLILGMSVYGSLGAWAFYIILGNYTYYLDLNKILDIQNILTHFGSGQVISDVMGTLPMGSIVRPIFALIAIIFIAGTYNSKAYALAASTSRGLNVGEDPARWNRVFWACTLGLLPIALMSIEGGIKIAMSAVLVASLPLLIICALMTINLYKSLTFSPKLLNDTPGVNLTEATALTN